MSSDTGQRRIYIGDLFRAIFIRSKFKMLNIFDAIVPGNWKLSGKGEL